MVDDGIVVEMGNEGDGAIKVCSECEITLYECGEDGISQCTVIRSTDGRRVEAMTLVSRAGEWHAIVGITTSRATAWLT